MCIHYLSAMEDGSAMQSMTGFGRATGIAGEVVVEVELKAVNARTSDVRCKLPAPYRAAEPQLRAKLLEAGHRGKFEILVERRDDQGGDLAFGINETLFKRYHAQLLRLAPAVSSDAAAASLAVLNLPHVVGTSDAEADEAEFAVLHATFQTALNAFVHHRATEGAALAQSLEVYVRNIADALPRVETYEAARETQMRQRLDRLISEHLSKAAVDAGRLEQECLYYLEKVDIAEEKVRLAQHCTFFSESLRDANVEKGRRLNFIAQEMGREINTLGAKAYNSDIQRVVVAMKEELEKIKEQLANAV